MTTYYCSSCKEFFDALEEYEEHPEASDNCSREKSSLMYVCNFCTGAMKEEDLELYELHKEICLYKIYTESRGETSQSFMHKINKTMEEKLELENTVKYLREKDEKRSVEMTKMMMVYLMIKAKNRDPAINF